MKILFLGDIVGISGRSMVLNNLLTKINDEKIDFVVVNGENAADSGVGLTEEICKDFFNCGVDVVTTGNHVWDQKEETEFILSEKRLLRPQNMIKGSPGNGFGIFNSNSPFLRRQYQCPSILSLAVFRVVKLYGPYILLN